MKTSKTTAAIRCAVAGRIAGQVVKFGMGRLVRTSHLSLLHQPVFCSTVAGYRSERRSSFTAITSKAEPKTDRKPRLAMRMQDTWRQDGDSRLAGTRITLNVMPSQENQTQKALALA